MHVKVRCWETEANTGIMGGAGSHARLMQLSMTSALSTASAIESCTEPFSRLNCKMMQQRTRRYSSHTTAPQLHLPCSQYLLTKHNTAFSQEKLARIRVDRNAMLCVRRMAHRTTSGTTCAAALQQCASRLAGSPSCSCRVQKQCEQLSAGDGSVTVRECCILLAGLHLNITWRRCTGLAEAGMSGGGPASAESAPAANVLASSVQPRPPATSRSAFATAASANSAALPAGYTASC